TDAVLRAREHGALPGLAHRPKVGEQAVPHLRGARAAPRSGKLRLANPSEETMTGVCHELQTLDVTTSRASVRYSPFQESDAIVLPMVLSTSIFSYVKDTSSNSWVSYEDCVFAEPALSPDPV